ncbi:phosphatase PAP2 family protein [Roseibium sp.]|uniref:phosphatase PAP2 family protein n=1 Tax=Roseibium sp. TaxID=1936156 RepID=UPI0032651123
MIVDNTTSRAFPDRYWEPDFRACLGMIRLLETPEWREVEVPPYPTSKSVQQHELDDLRVMQASPERLDVRRDEILEEADEVSPKFGRMMLFNGKSHPLTTRVVLDMVIGGRPIIMYFKNKFNRPRPSQVDPGILPLIDVPGHPAYPSGHSFQTHLVAHALGEFAPHLREPLAAIASRVAENREWAGVHYSSDSIAGRDLAEALFPMFKAAFAEDFEAAAAEWS